MNGVLMTSPIHILKRCPYNYSIRRRESFRSEWIIRMNPFIKTDLRKLPHR